MFTFEEYKEAITELNTIIESTSKELNEFPKGEMGLIPNSIRKSPEFISAQTRYDHATNTMRNINKKAPAKYKRMMQDIRRASWATVNPR